MRSMKRLLPALGLLLVLMSALSPAPVESQLSCFPPDGFCFSICTHGETGGFCFDVSFNEYFCHNYSGGTGCLGYLCDKCL
jgi:hypothetical protein